MTNTSADARPTVAVIGGGYGGMNVAKALDEFAEVTLVEPRDAFVHNVAALRALVEPEWLPRIFFPYDRLLANGRVVRDRAVGVERRRVTLASGAELTPDFIVLATGSTYPYPAKSGTDETATADPALPRESRRARAGRERADRGRRADRARAGRRDQRSLAGEADHDPRARARDPRRALQAGASGRGAPSARGAGRRVRARGCARPPSRRARRSRSARSRSSTQGRPDDRGRHLVSLLRPRPGERLPPRRPRERAAPRRAGSR